VPLLFALSRRLIVPSAALLTSLGTPASRMSWRFTSATSIPECLIPKPLIAFTSGSDAYFNSWLVASKLKPGKAVIEPKLLKQFSDGSFYGTIVNPSIFIISVQSGWRLVTGKYRSDGASNFRK